jgi:diguanylate cyclase (GGDEF)-like protein/PAS domain S-box-containing protein
LRRVLVVDDMEINRKVLRRILEREYEILEAKNGVEAMAVLNREYAVISAVVLDVLMPQMDGYEVLRRMRSDPKLSAIPVLMASSSNDEQTRVEALSLGASDFVTMPCNPKIILHCLYNSILMRENAVIINELERDRLNGVYNREAFFNRAGQILRSAKPGSYMMTSFDLDNFKLINDQMGTAEGDRILCFIGREMGQVCEGFGGLCGRISADNFACIYTNTPEADNFFALCCRTRFLPKEVRVKTTYSVGQYVINDLSLPVSAMYDRAYIAKESIKGLYGKHTAAFDDFMLQDLLREQQITGEMEQALADQQFEVWFQPQVNGVTGTPVGAEALVRWNHPQRGLISPGEFIPVFERNGFIYELDKYVWEQSCRYLRTWMDEGRQVLPVSLNISRCDVFREELMGDLLNLLKKYQLPAGMLRLEITESAFEKASGQIVQIIGEFRKNGFVVEIDDFGSGYSSLNTLKDVPADVLKLDMHFLTGSENSQRSGLIVEAVVRMASWLNISVLAEGVETGEQANFLKSIGCKYMQGFLYAKPMSAAAYREYLAGVKGEKMEFTVETVEHMDSGRFWDPYSLDTLVFNNFVGAACVFEFVNGRAELLRYNERYLKEVSASEGDASIEAGWNPFQEMDEKDRNNALDAVYLAIREQTETSCEVFFPSKQPEREGLYLQFSLRAIARAGTRYLIYCRLINTTQQRLWAERLRIREEEYRIAVQISGTVICRYRVDNKSVTMSEAAAKLLGLPQWIADVPESLIKEGIILPQDAENHRRMYQEIRAGQKSGSTVLLGKTANGRRWLQAQYSTIFTDAGEPSSAVISMNDITDNMEKENIYRKWQQALRQRGSHAYSLFRCNLTRRDPPTEQEGSLLSTGFAEGKRSFDEFAQSYAETSVEGADRGAFLLFLRADALLAGYYCGRRSSTFEYREKLPEGGSRWIRLLVDTVAYSTSAEIEAFLQFEDIDLAKRSELLTRQRALTDALTGVLNRNAFANQMGRAISDTPDGTCHALLMLDLDGFKRVNDVFGHGMGDRVLIELTEKLGLTLRHDDLLGRLGGDEFLVFMRGVSGERAVENKAKNICELARKEFGRNVRVSASVGIAVSPRDGFTFEEMYRKADAALYAVKISGRDHYAFYRSDMSIEHPEPPRMVPKKPKPERNTSDEKN